MAAPAIAGMLLPAASHVDVLVAAGRIGIVAAWWSSIVLASLPYVTIGAICASIVERVPRRPARSLTLASIVAPGCDCASAGFASAFVRESPSLAGFALVWSAAAGPAALFATYDALGPRLLIARLAGACAAAALTAALWSIDGRSSRANATATDSHACHSREVQIAGSTLATIASALGSLALSAAIATIALAVFGHAAAVSSPLIAAASGALMSPCSTADAVIARVLVHRPSSQIAFVLAAQTIDVRQLATFARVFGARRAAFALLAGAAGCACGALIAA